MLRISLCAFLAVSHCDATADRSTDLEVKKVQVAARHLLVQGVNTFKNGASGYLPHVDMISQVLKVKINTPGTSKYPED